ncbi:MAG: hypothetical protein NTV61_10710 [Candidatus Bathyarchaeota archaeon]|nr:hypothetical protein [Candidatus Bathyarchaeota archaeon]
MSRKILLIMLHEHPDDDWKFVYKISEVMTDSDSRLRILTKSSYLITDIREVGDDKYGIDPYLLDILNRNIEVAVSSEDLLFSDHVEYKWNTGFFGEVLYRIQQMNRIKKVDKFQYVATCVKDGYEIIKW